MKYDYIIVGSGLFGAVFAHEAKNKGIKVLVLEKRDHIGGNIYSESREGITIHRYGAHIFHTSNEEIWNYVKQFADFNNYINTPLANYKGEIYNLPFNMNTFNKMWGVITPSEAKKKIEEQRKEIKGVPKNLEEQAINLVGTDIYEKLIKGYTQKQWGRECSYLPSSIIKRLPVRYTYNNNYFNDIYQGIPIGGYTQIINKLLEGIEIKTKVDFLCKKEEWLKLAKKIIFTGTIDSYFNYKFGNLEYRGLNFELQRVDVDNYQGVAVMNFTDSKVPYTRIIEHKHFEYGKQPFTYITKEYPCNWEKGKEAYYPVNDDKNQLLYEKYKKLAQEEANIIFGGRLGMYKYYDMDKTIEAALELSRLEL